MQHPTPKNIVLRIRELSAIACTRANSFRKYIPTLYIIYKARDGHLIFCYGDCNRKFEEALSASRQSLHTINNNTSSTGQDESGGQPNALMKKFWLEIYNRHYRYRSKH